MRLKFEMKKVLSAAVVGGVIAARRLGEGVPLPNIGQQCG